MESEDRKLIKFSNYSLCVTLPKWLIKKLNWQKGDTVKVVVDEANAEIKIKKSQKKNISVVSKKETKSISQKSAKTKIGKKIRITKENSGKLKARW